MDSKERNKTEVTAEPIKDTISYAVFEGVQARNERNIKRLFILIIVLIALLFASNMAWLWVFSGYDMESYEYEQGDSGINIIGDDNSEVTFNGSKAENTENDEEVRLTGKDNTSES